MAIVSEKVEIIKQAYQKYLENAILAQIDESLEIDGILTGTREKHWLVITIKKILSNEK